jgi:hypothetical protein
MGQLFVPASLSAIGLGYRPSSVQCCFASVLVPHRKFVSSISRP